ncbi:MAG TPA: hypothetical protein VF883_03735 [Thermoanaerobaculia bacterium]|jgi:hypothetical protein
MIFVVIWPFALTDEISALAVGILVVVSFNALLFAAFSTTSAHLTYFRGLDLIAASFMSGCANITFLYIIPVLAVIQLIALAYATLGIFAGRQFSQHRWVILVNSFYERHAGTRLAAMEAIDPG